MNDYNVGISEMKAIIAARAGKGFYKSYVRDVKLVAERNIKDHSCGWSEKDYTFTHKGRKYRINSEIVADSEGNKKYSCEMRYTVEEIYS